MELGLSVTGGAPVYGENVALEACNREPNAHSFEELDLHRPRLFCLLSFRAVSHCVKAKSHPRGSLASLPVVIQDSRTDIQIWEHIPLLLRLAKRSHGSQRVDIVPPFHNLAVLV